MKWITIDSADKIYEAEDLSRSERVLIFKFSHLCSISHIVRMLLQREWNEGQMKMKTYLVNVIGSRDLSNDIAERFKVEHESPQVIILEKGKSVFNASHGQVKFENLQQFAN